MAAGTHFAYARARPECELWEHPLTAAVDARRNILNALWMIGAGLGFSLMAACIKLSGQHGAPLGQIIFYRGFGSLLLVLLQMRRARIPLATTHWRRHLLRGLTSFASMIVLFSAIRLLPLATAITLSFISPVILALLLAVLHRERASRSLSASLLASLVGVVLLLRPSMAANQWSGVLVGLASAALGAIAMLNMRAIGKLGESTWRSVFYFSLIVSVLSFPWFLASHPTEIDRPTLELLLLTAFFATLAQVMQTRAYEHRNTLLVSLLGYSQVLFTSVLGVLLWGDLPTSGWWMGMVLVSGAGAGAVVASRGSAATRTPAEPVTD